MGGCSSGASYALVIKSTRRLDLASLAASLDADPDFSFILMTFFWAVLGSSEEVLATGMAWCSEGVLDMDRMDNDRPGVLVVAA